MIRVLLVDDRSMVRTGFRTILESEDDFLFRALAAGASGFLLKTAEPEQLIDAVTALSAGDGLLSPEVTRRVIERTVATPEPAAASAPELEQLTERELEVLRLVAPGEQRRDRREALRR